MIDVHSHYVPRDLPLGMDAAAGWPTLTVGESAAALFIDGVEMRTLPSAAYDLTERWERVTRDGITCQVLSPLPLLFRYSADVAEGARFAEALNRDLKRAIDDSAGCFVGFGSLPMQSVDVAVEMVDLILELGFAGIEIGSNVNGVAVCDASFEPVFAAAAQSGLSVFVHASAPAYRRSLPNGPLGGAAGLPHEIAAVGGGLVVSGLIDRYPELRVLLSHGGGGLCTTLGRLDHAWRRTDRHTVTDDALAPTQVAQRLYYDTVVYDARVLELLVEVVGDRAVVLGSDFPAGNDRIGATVLESDLAPDVKASICFDNARRFLAIRQGVGIDG